MAPIQNARLEAALAHLHSTSQGGEPTPARITRLVQEIESSSVNLPENTDLVSIVLAILRGCAQLVSEKGQVSCSITDPKKMEDMKGLARTFEECTPEELRMKQMAVAANKIAAGAGIQDAGRRREVRDVDADRIRSLMPQLSSKIGYGPYSFEMTGVGIKHLPLRNGQHILSLCGIEEVGKGFVNRTDPKKAIAHDVIPMSEDSLPESVDGVLRGSDAIIRFAHAVKQGREAHVHCLAGANRSAMVGTAIIMAAQQGEGMNATWEDTLKFLQSQRPNIALSAPYMLIGHAMEGGQIGWNAYKEELLRSVTPEKRDALIGELNQIDAAKVDQLKALYDRVVTIFGATPLQDLAVSYASNEIFMNGPRVRPQIEALLKYAGAEGRPEQFVEAVRLIERATQMEGATIMFRPGFVKGLPSALEKVVRYGGPEYASGVGVKDVRPFSQIFNDVMGGTILINGGAEVLKTLAAKFTKSLTQVEGTPFFSIARPQRDLAKACYLNLKYVDPNDPTLSFICEVQIFARGSHRAMKAFHELAKINNGDRPRAWAQYKAIFALIGLAQDNGLSFDAPVSELEKTDDKDIQTSVKGELEKLTEGQKRLSLRELARLETPDLVELFGSSRAFIEGGPISEPVDLVRLKELLLQTDKTADLKV